MVYKKSHVLYGLDLARRNIGKENQVVVVEGYTDVMACHIAGVDTAVASCGTAFGEEHGRMVQRLMTGDAMTGEVVFTFDGDAAGQAAAMKMFSTDATFTAQTYVAVARGGLDPCDLRIREGDAAVRERSLRVPAVPVRDEERGGAVRPRPRGRAAGGLSGRRHRWWRASGTRDWSADTFASWPGSWAWTTPRCARR